VSVILPEISEEERKSHMMTDLSFLGEPSL